MHKYWQDKHTKKCANVTQQESLAARSTCMAEQHAKWCFACKARKHMKCYLANPDLVSVERQLRKGENVVDWFKQVSSTLDNRGSSLEPSTTKCASNDAANGTFSG